MKRRSRWRRPLRRVRRQCRIFGAGQALRSVTAMNCWLNLRSPRKSLAQTPCWCDAINRTDSLRVAAALDGHLTATIFGDGRGSRRQSGADPDSRAEGRPADLQRLPYRRRSLARDGSRRSVSINFGPALHFGRQPGDLPLRAAGLLPGFSEAMLPPELQEANPLGIARLRDGKPE